MSKFKYLFFIFLCVISTTHKSFAFGFISDSTDDTHVAFCNRVVSANPSGQTVQREGTVGNIPTFDFKEFLNQSKTDYSSVFFRGPSKLNPSEDGMSYKVYMTKYAGIPTLLNVVSDEGGMKADILLDLGVNYNNFSGVYGSFTYPLLSSYDLAGWCANTLISNSIIPNYELHSLSINLFVRDVQKSGKHTFHIPIYSFTTMEIAGLPSTESYTSAFRQFRPGEIFDSIKSLGPLLTVDLEIYAPNSCKFDSDELNIELTTTVGDLYNQPYVTKPLNINCKYAGKIKIDIEPVKDKGNRTQGASVDLGDGWWASLSVGNTTPPTKNISLDVEAGNTQVPFTAILMQDPGVYGGTFTGSAIMTLSFD